jgi:2,3-dihydroxybenzoate-AMP ligase
MTDFVPWPPDFAQRYRTAGYWLGQPLGDLIANRGDAIAVVDGDRRWTYRELDDRAHRMAAGFLKLGIARGDRVVVQLPNIAEFLEVVFALFRIGALPVFALPSHRFAEVGHFCRFTDAVGYVIADRHAGFDYRALATRIKETAQALRHVLVVGEPGEFTALRDVPTDPVPIVPPAAAEVAFLQLSGGSTGVPKLIPRTHDDYHYSVRASAEICGLDQDTRYLVALPAAHNFTMSSPGILGTLHAGGRVVFAPAPSPDVAFPLIAREAVTITAVVPPLALIWLAAAGRRAELASLRVLQVGGAKLAEEVARRVEPTLGCALQQVFGMAEGLVNYTRLDDPEDIVAGTQGRPISVDDEIRVVDGELLTRGPYTIRGYYRAAEHNAIAFTEDGFYRTGDLVDVLPSGHLVVRGRVKELINRGGEKVAAEEVENHLLAHPGVHDAVIVPVPDRFLGERTCAVVIARGEPPAAVELREFLRDRGLADYKLPDRVEFVPAFPETAVGKTSRRDLRTAVVQQLPHQ